MRVALVILGGGIGSAGRYLIGNWTASHFTQNFPWGTLTVNITGSFLIGLIATLADESGTIGLNARVFLVAGVLGGFTTFSAFSLESWRLLEGGAVDRVLLYVSASLALAFVAVVAGVLTGRALT